MYCISLDILLSKFAESCHKAFSLLYKGWLHFSTCFYLLEDVPIFIQEVIISSYSPKASFLSFFEASTAFKRINSPVRWSYKIYQLHLCRWVRPLPNECPDYDIKQSDGEVPALGLYSRNTNISRNIIKHNIRTSMNERINFFIKIYLSHFILEGVMFVVCERWVGDRDRLLYWPTFFSRP